MSLTTTFKTDQKKEIEGVKVLYPANEDGTVPCFIIRRTSRSNKEYAKSLERNMRPVQALLRTKSLKNEQADKLLMQTFVEGALVTWMNVALEDVTGEDSDKGKYAEYSQENAIKLLTRLPDMFEDLQMQANDMSLFREGGSEEQSAKN